VNPRALVLEIVTPDGVALSELDVDAVIVHRRERRFERGSEIAVYPLHGPMLVRIPVAPVRYRRRGETVHLAVGGGFMEVLRDRVLIVTRRMERIPAAAPGPRAAAGDVCRRWRREAEDTQVELVGYP
jgi:F-type H+-transporting ATPase subunit epsilon